MKYYNQRGRRVLHILLFFLIMSVMTIFTANTLPVKEFDEITVQDRILDLLHEHTDIASDKEKEHLSSAVCEYGEQYDIDPLLLLAIARVESTFRKRVVGSFNCIGYYQINLNVHKVSDNFANNTFEQTKMACKVYDYYRKMYPNNRKLALNGYNGYASLSNPYATKVLKHYNYYTNLIIDED
jgi:hypothetical protein